MEVAACLGFAGADRGLAQILDLIKQGCAGLLAKHFAQQHAEGADVAAQGSFLFLAGAGLQLVEAVGPAGGFPKRRDGFHPSIMREGCSGGGWTGEKPRAPQWPGRLENA